MTIIIKPYYSQVETPTVRSPLLYSQEDPGAQAIQGFGRGVTALGDKLLQRLEQKKKEEEEMPYLTRPERERWTEKVKSPKPIPRPRYRNILSYSYQPLPYLVIF